MIENREAGGFDRFMTPEAAEAGIPWPLPALTRIAGGFRPGNVTVIGAGTGKGKTTIATQAALHAAGAGYCVAILTPEMTALELTKKITAQNGRACLSDWLRGDATRDDLALLARSAHAVHRLRIAIDDRSDVTPGMLDVALTRLQKQCKVDLLIVDYIQLLDSGLRDEGANREQHVATISRHLKKLTKKHSLAAIVLTQLNDDGKVRESRGIGMDASNVLILNDKGGGNYEAILQKGRFEARRTIPLWFDGRSGLFLEVENQ
jgi:replicative DNA helicase